jgi:hypothetical protein
MQEPGVSLEEKCMLQVPPPIDIDISAFDTKEALAELAATYLFGVHRPVHLRWQKNIDLGNGQHVAIPGRFYDMGEVLTYGDLYSIIVGKGIPVTLESLSMKMDSLRWQVTLQLGIVASGIVTVRTQPI